MRIHVRTPNLERVQKRLRDAPDRIDRHARKALQNVIAKIEGDGKRNAPVDSGRLRSSIFSQMLSPTSGKIEVGAKYGVFVHEGTRPHIIERRNKKVLADRRAGEIYGVRVRHPGTKENPFLFDALKENQRYINDEFTKAVRNAFK